MSLKQSVSFSPLVELTTTKFSNKSKLPNLFFGKSKSRNSGKISFSHNGYPYFTAPRHPLESELPTKCGELPPMPTESDVGIGIDSFFEGKNIFITGGTGLLGKTLIEKLLRSTSLGKIFVLVKAGDKEAAVERLTKEIMNSDLFVCLREKHGSTYEEYVKSKLIPIVGNICEPNIGMDINSANKIMEEVDVIVESAASTTLNDRYDFLLDINVNAPLRLMRFAKKCKNLKLFVHISTAYVNGIREGIIYEKPLIMGENGRKHDDNDEISSSLFPLDLTDEMNLAMKACIASKEHDTTKELKRLGLERAAYYGWYNAYHMTKAMGEMVLNETRQDVPLLILRPSVVESCYKAPVPGWIQGNRMYDPVIISYGKGQLPAYLADPDLHTDIVPVDYVANTTIAAIAKHGIPRKAEVNVYHVATDFVNPLRFNEMFEYIYEHFRAYPLVESENIVKMRMFDQFSDLSKYLRDRVSERNAVLGEDAKVRKQNKARVAYAEQLCKMYEFIGFFKARFHTGNTRALLEEMSEEEREVYEVDATKIDWNKYFVDIHIHGLRKHVVNGTRLSV
ncbi:fatty acyl-CoA reductase 2, chloroplastic-like [Salvia hispanica]|uniref:fatty acyl-CoA reductase 2, chloroplastic-like n=1 Tax=Salvia hispanica TaxID=49212 RepID=UPI002008F2AF|nr:fatty acyl-CoA reductase 2, chloroplastic-like [Salvia hispanica]